MSFPRFLSPQESALISQRLKYLGLTTSMAMAKIETHSRGRYRQSFTWLSYRINRRRRVRSQFEYDTIIDTLTSLTPRNGITRRDR